MSAYVSSLLLTSTADGALVGMKMVAGLSILAALAQPYLLMRLSSAVPKAVEANP